MTAPYSRSETADTICCYCGVGCGMTVTRKRNGQLQLEGNAEYPVNRGLLCSKGRNLHYTAMNRTDRILHPMMRKSRGNPLQQTDWNTAMDRIAATVKLFMNRYGPDSFAFYVSGQCLTEEYYLVNKLAKGFLKTNNIDTNSRLCMSSAVTAYKMSLGEDAVPICYDDIELADTFLIAGANPSWCHPILFQRILARKEADPTAKIIVIDPRRTQSCEQADLHLQINPGTDVTLFHAVARLLIEAERIDRDFIADHTNGFEKLRETVFLRTPAEAATICGVPESEIRLCADWIGGSEKFLSFWAMGLNQSAMGVQKNLALINLSLITGKIGKPGCGPFSLTGQPNAMGGREVGGLSTMLAAHRDLGNAAHREEVAAFWGTDSIRAEPGLTATEMFDALHAGTLKVIWIICTNPMVSIPDLNRAESALAKAKLVIVQDISRRSDTAAMADILLPAAAWLEKEGTMTNSERRIAHLPKILHPPGEARADTEIIMDFAARMGFGGSFRYQNPEEIFLEHCRLTKGTNIDISGLNYTVLKERKSVQWPFPEAGGSGTERLFRDHRFHTKDGRANMYPADESNISEPPDPAHPLVLTTGRIRDQWHTMTKTGKVAKLNRHYPEAFLEIHPDDAAARNLRPGDEVSVANSRGEVTVKCQITDSIKQGVVFLPMHWGKTLQGSGHRANNLTSPLVDRLSKEPDFKFARVEVTPIHSRKKKRILIIGAGAASYRFITAYRERNTEDEITVLCREENAFYNRVMLPDLLSGRKDWTELQYFTESEKSDMGVHLITGVSADQLDLSARKVTDSRGREHHYDTLVIATGSRAALPKNTPVNDSRIFTLRTREHAARIGQTIGADRHAVIVGGGLLGLELAHSLMEKGARVTIIQRGEYLMRKNLDAKAADFLAAELQELGLEIIFRENVQEIIRTSQVFGVRLSGGRRIFADALIYTTGIIPNTELARASGIPCNNGIIVDRHLKTAAENVYAIGEVAEFEGEIYGISSAAFEQAEIAVRHILGEEVAEYSGSVFKTILKIPGLQVCSLGDPRFLRERPGIETVIVCDEARRIYRKFLLENDILVAAVMIGNTSGMSRILEMIRTGTELGEKRDSLLAGGSDTSQPVQGRLICSCNSIGEGNLTAYLEKSGPCSLETICSATGAGTGCGSCRPEVLRLIRAHEPKEAMLAI